MKLFNVAMKIYPIQFSTNFHCLILYYGRMSKPQHTPTPSSSTLQTSNIDRAGVNYPTLRPAFWFVDFTDF